ncbi:MAG TPA: hypothetical protein VET24_08455 [Actinomycetota bacterium]|nr:hypothetical protein [Actinomycetota bacterium]
MGWRMRLGTLVASLVAACVVLVGPAAAPAPALGPVSQVLRWLERLTPRAVIIDGHCQLVDANGVPLTDSLSWQRTGHDPC